MSHFRKCPVCRDVGIRRLDQRTCGRECMGIWNTWTNQQKARALELAEDGSLDGTSPLEPDRQWIENILTPKPAEDPPLPDILKGFDKLT